MSIEEQPQAEGEASPDEEQDSSPEPTTDAPDAEAQIGDTTPEESTDEPDEKPKPKRGFQKRISGLNDRLQRQQAEIDALRAERTQTEVKEPEQDDYPDYEKYLEARAEFAAEQKFVSLQTEAAAKQVSHDRVQQQNALDQRWDDSLQESRDAHEDFDDIAFNDGVEISEPMSLAIKDCKVGGEIAYYLGKNPKEATAIARLSHVAQFRAIGAIEERLKERPNRPAPPKPVTRGRTSQTTASTALNDNLSMKDWQKLRNKQAGR